ncbi:hypothetical protein [Brevundimonas sp.]|uniref:hypothetical protein n=1 Tax=Brevundimonas sp. TaxID=1871086 RepID=UPI0025BB0123|nr:hypothetical protein [Brevundimonas sp.]
MRRPFRIDEITKQVIKVRHPLFQDPLAGLDGFVSICERLQAYNRLGGLFGAFVFTQSETVGTFVGDADFVAAGHGREWTSQRLRSSFRTS